jgi:hypothetical protein
MRTASPKKRVLGSPLSKPNQDIVVGQRGPVTYGLRELSYALLVADEHAIKRRRPQFILEDIAHRLHLNNVTVLNIALQDHFPWDREFACLIG